MPTASTDAATAAPAPPPVTREPVADTSPLANPFAALPALVPTLPPAGRRTRCRRLPDRQTRSRSRKSACRRVRSSGCSWSSARMRSRRSVSPTKSPGSRLRSPSASFPTGKRCPTIISRRTRTSFRSGSRRSTAITRGECDVAIVAAQTALYRLAPPSFLAAHHVLPHAGPAARRRRAARAARARRLHARHAGRLARRIQRARRA